MEAIVVTATPTLTPRYTSRDHTKALMIGKLLVAQGFLVTVGRRVNEVTDLNTGEVVHTETRYVETQLRTNATKADVDAARASYRAAQVEITTEALATKLGI